MNENKMLWELSHEERTKVLIDRIATHLQYRKEIEENQEDVDNVKALIKDTFEDIKNPFVNRVYKLNLEKESRFDVDVELRNRTETEGVCDPFADLKQEPNITQEDWDVAAERHKKYFEEEYERLKTWYSEKTKDMVGKDWVPIDPNSKPSKTELILDDEIINMASGFMVGPVGLYNGRAVHAETHKYPNLEEMRIFLKVLAKTQDMVLYMTFKKDNVYFFRGAFVPKEKAALTVAV